MRRRTAKARLLSQQLGQWSMRHRTVKARLLSARLLRQ
jgi:hypothetical protein